MNRRVFVRVGNRKLLLATVGSEGVIVNSSLDFNLVNELRRLFTGMIDDEELSLEISEGSRVLRESYPEPDGMAVMDAADLIVARARVQSSLDLLMAANLPAWVAKKEELQTRIKLVELIEKFTEQINLKLTGSSDA